jgi:hypothetical protein
VKGKHSNSPREFPPGHPLYVPPAWRKSLKSLPVERDLFSDLIDDEEPHPDDQAPSPSDEDDDEAVDDLP